MIPPDAKLAISFSGGRTSAVMTNLLLKQRGHHNTVVTFDNTGCEIGSDERFGVDIEKEEI